MPVCCRCGRDTCARVNAKVSDCCDIEYADGSSNQGYPEPPLGQGDYLRFTYCMRCGQIQEIVDAGGDVNISAGSKVELKQKVDHGFKFHRPLHDEPVEGVE